MASVQKLPAATSLTLDVVRFAASVLVAVGHLTQPHFSTGWPDLTDLAVRSVAVFFVLSGFVIRYVSRSRYATLGEYWVDRASRIYSVVLPAVACTVAVDLIAWAVNPQYYLANWGGNIDYPLLRLVTNLTFTSQLWSHSIALFSNGPFWSLAYECFYYAVYGCAFYLRGVKRGVAVAAVILFGGNHIFLLLPLWLLGCVLCDVYFRLLGRGSVWSVSAAFAAAAAVCALVYGPFHAAVFSTKDAVTRLFLAHHHQPVNLHWTLLYYVTGVPAAFLLLWALLVVGRVSVDADSRGARAVRLLSEGTFPLYLFHFPVFVLAGALLPYDHGSAWSKIFILLVVVSAGVALAWPTNLLKLSLRGWLRRRFLPERRMPAARPLEAT